MSIIYDALKKVEKLKSDIKNIKFEADKDLKPKQPRRNKIYLVYAGVLCLGFFITNIFLNIFNSLYKNLPKEKSAPLTAPSKPTPSKPTSESSNVLVKEQSQNEKNKNINIQQELPKEETSSAQINLPGPSDTEKQPLPSLVLNGVFFSGDQGYALVNNRIIKEGDVIEGATVKQITLEGVELEFEGSISKLSTSTR